MTVIERFMDYVTYETTSDEQSSTCPSTACQKLLGQRLAEDLRAVGLTDAAMDENSYVYGHLPATPGCETAPGIGLIAHMDTSPDVSGKDVKPRIITYDGTNASMLEDKFLGKEMIVSDGTTLLGADDKAGVAEIIAACAELTAHPERRHGRISVCFTPDEEIGSGADHFDFARFDADYAYTVDGGEVDEFEYENFNAAAADLVIHGVNTHPGSAKNKMRNAVLYAAEWISLLPAAETPAHTEGREGFYHVADVSGNETEARVHMIVRDHDREKFEQRKAFLTRLAAYLNDKYGAGTFELTLTDSYYNMREKIEPHREIIDRAMDAMRQAGLDPVAVPIRGGTDGARLSFEGLPCPNLPTGGVNFHSIYEAIPVEALHTMVQVLLNIVAVQ
mgnify:CR=1 FL=1